MDVSVVIPALNEEGSIGACLESLEAQVRDGDEVVVLDNGSTDDTAAIAQGFEFVTVLDVPDERLDQTLHYRGGLDALRQFGAEQASNPIIATTDADSIPPEGWLDRIRTHFQEDDDLDLVWGVPVDINGVPMRNLESRFVNLFGAISGCNTAFRKTAFEDLTHGYVGWPGYEDATLVTRMARRGSVKHDRDLVMPTDMERTRFQTIPLLVVSGVGIGAGTLLGGPAGAFAVGTGVGVGGTELTYEALPSTRFHHDQIGLLAIIGGVVLGGPYGLALAGAGTGTLAHHALTEGISGLPTDLMESTDAVCEVPQQRDGETVVTEIDCSPPEGETDSLTRILAGVAIGTVAGAGLARLNA